MTSKRVRDLIEAINYYRYGLGEMAFTRKAATARLQSLTFQIANHLMLVCLYPGNEAWRHWVGELEGWRKELSRLNRSKAPSGFNYTRAILWMDLWKGPFDTEAERRSVARDVSDDKGLPYVNPSEPRLRKLVSDFVDSVLAHRPFSPEETE